MNRTAIYYTTDAKRDLVRLPLQNERYFCKALELGAMLHGDSVRTIDLFFRNEVLYVTPRDEPSARFFCVQARIVESDDFEESLYWALNEEVDLPGIRTLLINLRTGWGVTIAVNAPDFA